MYRIAVAQMIKKESAAKKKKKDRERKKKREKEEKMAEKEEEKDGKGIKSEENPRQMDDVGAGAHLPAEISKPVDDVGAKKARLPEDAHLHEDAHLP